VRGYDHEAPAVEAASANAAANGVAVGFERRDLRRGLPDLGADRRRQHDRAVLKALAVQLDAERAPRTMVCSGLLPPELDETAAAFAPVGLREVERRGEGDWAALLLRR